jgi:DNA topoisomerase IA
MLWLFSVVFLGGVLFGQRPDPFPDKKKLLAIGDVRTGFQHDSVSHALATIERLGYESGAYITYIRTDSQLLTKRKIERKSREAVDSTRTAVSRITVARV